MLTAPDELTRIRVFGGSSAVTETPVLPFKPNKRAPIRAAHFEGGDVTPEMALAAEALSARHQNKRRAAR